MMMDLGTKLEGLAGEPAVQFTRHRDAMLVLDRLEEIAFDRAVCTWRVPKSHPLFGTPQGVPAYVGIECMAQCVAVHAGALASMDGHAPPLGLLLGTRLFRASEDFLREGVKYHITCRELVRDSQGLASFDCEIRKANSTIAACRLTVFEYQQGSRLDESDA